MIFWDFTLPNATTWFYFSLLLAMALFFKFTRLLSVRNLDVLLLFVPVPGFLLLQERGLELWGYVWLLAGSACLLVRCLFDLALVRRPVMHANLNFGGLAWMAATLFICLLTVAINRPTDPQDRHGQEPLLTQEAEKQASSLVVSPGAALPGADDRDAHFWVGRILATLCHLVIVVGLVVVGRRHFRDIHAGMAAATFYLLLPYTAAHFGQWHHVLPMALVVWAVVACRRPLVSGTLLGLAAGTVYFPLLMVPTWWGFYRRRGACRFLAAFALTFGLCLSTTALVLWWHNDLVSGLESVKNLSAWQPWREPARDTPGFWTGVTGAWAYRIPVFVAYLALVLATFVWPWPRNLAHVLALSAACVIGVQFWYADEGGTYVLWYLPLLLLVVFRPNLSDFRPAPINTDTDRLTRLSRWFWRTTGRLLRRALHLPETPVAQT